MRKVNLKISLFTLVISLVSTGLVFAAQSPPQDQSAAPSAQGESTSMSQIVDRIVGREAVLAVKLRSLHPMVETYLQNLDKDDQLAFHPHSDKYFLGKLDFNTEEREHTMLKKGFLGGFGKITQLYSVKYLPGGFAQMIVLSGHFDRTSYDIEYVRREFLGEVRTLVFDVTPKKGVAGTFRGRIWAEDQDYNVVRFNGTFVPSTAAKMYFHFDSWREHMGNRPARRRYRPPWGRPSAA